MKTIVFLFSGESRTFPFSINKHMRSEKILESYNKFIFTEKFKKMYNYKVYITTDDLHLRDTINYFSSSNIGNIHLLNTNYYLIPPLHKTTAVGKYLTNYNNKEWGNHIKYENSIYQHHKLLDCYNLAKDEPCDFIVRVRLDTEIQMDILDMLEAFTDEVEIVLKWDWFAVGRPEIMKTYCTGLDNNYGNYNYQTPVPDVFPVMHDYLSLDKHKWTYAPERQLFEMLFEYCYNKGVDINKTIVNKHNNCCIIVRQT